MPIDHISQARELEIAANSAVALREKHAQTTEEIRAYNHMLDVLLGTADYHRSEAGDTQALTPENLSNTAQQVLAPHTPKTTSSDPLVGKEVRIIKGPYKGADGIIESNNPDKTANVRISQTILLQNQQPGIHFGHKICPKKTA